MKNKIQKSIFWLLIAVLVSLLFYCVYSITMWHNQYEIKLQNIFLVEPREKPLTIVREAKAKERPDLDEILANVYQLESSSGKNDGCIRKGKFNGYGYAQNKHNWSCFDTHTQVTELVATWFADNLKTMDLPTALCYYNTGYKVTNCKYYQNYLKL